MQSSGYHAAAVEHHQVARFQIFGEAAERAMFDGISGPMAIQDQQPRGVTGFGWGLGDQLRRQVIVEIAGAESHTGRNQCATGRPRRRERPAECC